MKGTISVKLNVIEIFQKYRLSLWHPRIQTCRTSLGFEQHWGGVVLVVHKYLNCLSKLKSLEIELIFKLLYVVHVNLDVFLQKNHQNWTGYLCFQANYQKTKQKLIKPTNFLKNFI